MNHILFFILFFSLAWTAFSQRSLDQKKLKIDNLLSLSHRAYVDVDILVSMENALEAKLLSEDANYSEGRARSNFYIAQVLSSVGDYEQSLEYIALAEKEKYTASNPGFYAEVSRMQGRILGMLGLYRSAIHVFKKGMSHIVQVRDSAERLFLESLAYDNLSAVHTLLNEADSAVHYLEKNRELLNSADEVSVYRNLINLYGQYGRVYTSREVYDSAAYYLDEAFMLADKYQFPYTSYIYIGKGELEAKRGDYPTALDSYCKGLDNMTETGVNHGVQGLYQAIADVYEQLGKPDSVQHYLSRKSEVERELAKTNTHALDNAVKALLEEERGQYDSKFRTTLSYVTIIGVGVILLVMILWYFWRRRNKRILAEKEHEVAVLEEKLSDAAIEVIELAKKNDDAFLVRFNELYPDFIRDIYMRHPSLTHSEYLFCVLIYLHFTSKEIAQILCVEHRSVQTRKNRLRKKLGIPSETDLYQYLKTLDSADGS